MCSAANYSCITESLSIAYHLCFYEELKGVESGSEGKPEKSEALLQTGATKQPASVNWSDLPASFYATKRKRRNGKQLGWVALRPYKKVKSKKVKIKNIEKQKRACESEKALKLRHVMNILPRKAPS